jgi:ribosomal protein L23
VSLHPNQVLLAPVVSEKSFSLISDRKYTFRVHEDAHKTQIRQAVEELFDVKVDNVNILKVQSKPKRRGLTKGRRPGWKKAIVQLKPGHEIESDDTSCLRLRTATGLPISIAVTLCAAENSTPELIVHGTAGRITLAYKTDTLTLERTGHAPVSTVHPCTGLLENLVTHLRSGTPLLCPPDSVTGFMSVLEAVRRGAEEMGSAGGGALRPATSKA